MPRKSKQTKPEGIEAPSIPAPSKKKRSNAQEPESEEEPIKIHPKKKKTIMRTDEDEIEYVNEDPEEIQDGKAQPEEDTNKSHPSTPPKPTGKPLDLKPIASPGAHPRKETKDATITVHVSAMTWDAWSLSFRVYSAAQGKDIDAWTGLDSEPDTIAHCLRFNMNISWIKEKRRNENDQWHFVRLTPDIPCTRDGFAKIQASIQALFTDKKAEWSTKSEAEFTTKNQNWIKKSWSNQLTFILTNTEYPGGELAPWPWDKYMNDRNILRLARDCFPGTSYRELDTAGGFYGEATDEEGNLMTLEKAANPMPIRPMAQGAKHKQYDI
jgi:hypothetical protein